MNEPVCQHGESEWCQKCQDEADEAVRNADTDTDERGTFNSDTDIPDCKFDGE